jgi:DNA-binding LacI/PurR family transcriptional regulator
MKRALYKIIADELKQNISMSPLSISERKTPKIKDIQKKYNCSSYTAHKALTFLKDKEKINIGNGSKKNKDDFSSNNIIKGSLLAVYPKWDILGDDSFASQMVFGCSIACSENGYTSVVQPYNEWAWCDCEDKDSRSIINLLEQNIYKGVVWANPGIAEVGTIVKLLERGIKVVTTHRQYSGLFVPTTQDNFLTAINKVIEGLKAKGIRSLGILGPAVNDSTYIPVCNLLIKKLKNAGIDIPENAILYRPEAFPVYYTKVILEHYFKINEKLDAVWTFTPNILMLIEELRNEKRIISKQLLGCLSKKTYSTEIADIIIESDIKRHGREAMLTLVKSLETGESIIPRQIPCKVIIK